MTTEVKDPKATILAGLKRREAQIVDFGHRIHALYPLTKIPPEVFENITVPVPLPVAMMLYGLASLLVAEMPPLTKETPNAP